MTENRTNIDAAVAASMAFDGPAFAGPLPDGEYTLRTGPARRPVPMPDPDRPAAVMTAAPNVAPPNVAELEDACLTAYALLVRARRRLTEAEGRLTAAVRAGRP